VAVFYFTYYSPFFLSLHLLSKESLKKPYHLPTKKLPLKNHSKNIPKLEKFTQKPIQKIALKNSRSSIHKNFNFIKN